ncbi:MAG: hypothetical protein QOE39_2956, partial [Bradyrhizobium sp.]|nr:hypothetical protein [Bradyrhizobium sp.]
MRVQPREWGTANLNCGVDALGIEIHSGVSSLHAKIQ